VLLIYSIFLGTHNRCEWVLAHPGYPGQNRESCKMAVRVSVCVHVCEFSVPKTSRSTYNL